mmetsp:Transcript_19376/g.36404  ORF Transcript_19376/g.36404 Transcript_19376/m.36404 type:complete len:501 (-) Transcript_19376:46-1548(-)
MNGHHGVTRLDHVVLLSTGEGLGDDGVRALERRRQDRDDAADRQKLPQVRLTGGDAEDGACRTVLGNESRRCAGLTQSNDQRALGIHHRFHGGGAHRLNCRHSEFLLKDELSHVEVQGLVVKHGLCLLADPAHRGNSRFGELAIGGLAGEHDNVCSIEHGVKDVGRFCPRGARGALHRVQHLRGGHHKLALLIALHDNHLLHEPDLLDVNLHAHVTASNHDAIARRNDLVDVVDAFLVLNLGDDPDGTTSHAERVPNELHVLGILDERCCNEVDPLRNAKLHKVLLVLLLQNWELNLNARQIHVLLLADGDVIQHLSDNVVCAGALDFEGQRAICGQDDLARLHCCWKRLVAACNAGLITLEVIIIHELQVLAGFQVDLSSREALLEEASSDFRALGVEKDRHWLVRTLLGGFADSPHRGPVALMIAVRKVQPADVHALVDELHQHVNIPAARSHGANDLALALEGVSASLRQGDHGRPSGGVIKQHRGLLVHDCWFWEA